MVNDDAVTSYRYPGGTLHLAPWAALLVPVVLAWLGFYFGNLQFTLLVLLIVGAPFIIFGALLERYLLRQPGEIRVVPDGIVCTLPWGRKCHLAWYEIEAVRLIRPAASLLNREVAQWEIRTSDPGKWIRITYELKGYKDLLRTIRVRATHCKHFDEISE